MAEMELGLGTKVLAEPAFTGREQELQKLEFFLNSTIEGKGKSVFISGEAGCGKTRLAREFLDRAKKKDVTLMAGWCLSDAAIPYFPFIEAFSGYFTPFDEEEQLTSFQQPNAQIGVGSAVQFASEHGMAELLTGPKPVERLRKPETLSPQVWKDQAFAAVAKTLNAIQAQVPILLFLEDIHWADSASLALLHYIARAINNSQRVLVLATFRSEELTADAEGHPHPLSEAMRMMRREDLFTEIKLSSLSQSNVSKIVENMIGGSLQPALAEKLTSESRGNPLFIVESLRMLHERKSLIQEDNQWRLAVDALGIPPKIKDIILRRLAVLNYAQRRVLDAASVIGEKFDVELLSTMLGMDSLDVLETLNLVAHSTSLVCAEENYYRFDHAKSRETLYEELSPPLKRGYHARIAEKLENTKDARTNLSDLAFHYAQAGNTKKALKYALAAGKDELARFSNQQAIQHFRWVLQNTPDTPERSEERETVLEGLGDAYADSQMYSEAIKTFEQLAAFGRGAVRLRAIRKAMDAAFLKGDKPDILLEYAKKAEELAACDRLEMARVLDNRGRAFGYAGRGDLKLDLADYDAALQVFEEENSLSDAADALWRSGCVSAIFEDLVEKGLDELLRSVSIFKELGDVRKEIEAELYTGVTLTSLGLAEGRREFVNILEIGEKLGAFTELATASVYLSYYDEFDGKFVEALSHGLKALEYCKKTDAYWVHGYVYQYLGRVYSKLGDLKHADEYFDRIGKLPQEILSHIMVGPNLAPSKAIYLAAKTQWEESNNFFEKLLSTGRMAAGNEGMTRIDYAWVLEKQGRAEEARAQRARVNALFDQVEERFGHANLQLSVMVPRKLQVGEEFEMRLDLVNVGRRPSELVKIDGAIPPEFKVVDLPSFCSLQTGSVEMKEKSISGFQVETIKLKLNVTKAGSYILKPEVLYVNDLSMTKAFKADLIAINVQPAQPRYEVLLGRIPTGSEELDALLLGGIPQNYAVVLSSPSSDDRELLIEKFLEAGAIAGETTFHITAETGNAKAIAEKYLTNFFLFVCNPQADAMFHASPNVFKLKGVENLTDIDIALAKAFRMLKPKETGPKRICIEIISDALLQHHAVNTRRWLSALLPTLKLKGFTILAVVDPSMHPTEELQAILGVFDGEIRVSEKETPEGIRQALRVRKLINQKYSDKEIALNKEALMD